MARRRFKATALVTKLVMLVAGTLLTGLLAILFTRLFGRHVTPTVAVPVGVGLAIALTLWVTQLLKHPPLLLSKTSPLIAGFCAALGVHVARIWLT